MDINQVRFGNYSIGNSANPRTPAKSDEEQTAPQAAPQAPVSQGNDNGWYDAMDIAASQYKAQINYVPKKELDVSEYIDETRAADIEAMMADFESGVDEVYDIVGEELPGVFTQEEQMALAAQVYANLQE